MTSNQTDPVLRPAALRWTDDQPFSVAYGDIYHAPDGAAEVSRVFLAPSGLGVRLDQAARRSDAATGSGRQALRVGELGFGSGLNFIVTAQACLDAGVGLHFVSFEAAPIGPEDFARLASRRAREHALYAELQQGYPPLIRGWHRRHLAGGRICLSVYWGDAHEGLAELRALGARPMDAWFLDGFAPDRNPDLWAPALFESMAQLCTTGTTVATFTAAGRVRRGLQAAGFSMRRVDQRPHKRESLAGVFAGPAASGVGQPAQAIVIGAGLAGASAAWHLAQAGVRVRVYDPLLHPTGAGQPQNAPSPGELLPASRVPATVLHGRLLADPGPAGLLRCHAYLYAAALVARFAEFRASGVLQLPAPGGPQNDAREATASITESRRPPRGRLAAIYATYGNSGPWLQSVDQAAAQRLSDWPVASGGLWFPDGGIVDTPGLCAALLQHPLIETVATAAVLSDRPAERGVPVVLACGLHCLAAPAARYLELAAVHGQLDFVTLDAPAATAPRAPIVGNGYLVPHEGQLAAGATYEYQPWDPARASQQNLQQLGDRPLTWHRRIRGTRTVSSDRTAIAGRLLGEPGGAQPDEVSPDQAGATVYVSTGHGSMGNVSSHFAGALIAARICGDAPPMSPALEAQLSPLRFHARQQRRGYRHGGRE
jgi:tRNA 5-methylaminomethyl-2-thiouridine biosynthesis bifunctional protein